MSDIASELKREEERGEALDREIAALLVELSKYEMASTADYTAGIIDQQVRQQDKEYETRFASLMTTQKSIKTVLDQTSSIYDTANSIIPALWDTVSHAERDVEKYRSRVECLQRKKENAHAALTQKVATQKSIIEGFCEKFATDRVSPGLEKLMSSLRKLKIDEEASFTSVKKGLEQTTVDINNNIQTRDDLLRSIAQAEAQCDITRKCLANEKEYVHLQTLRIAENEKELDILRKKKDEAIMKVTLAKCILEKLRTSDAAEKLLALVNETKSVDERLSQLRDDRSAFEEQRRAEELTWQREITIKKEEVNEKRADLERRIKSQEEELQLTRSRLEVLRERFGDKSNWTEEEWRQALKGLSDERARLTSEMTKYMVAAEELKKELGDQRQEKSYEEVVLALERDLLAFTDRIALEKKIMQERRLKVLSRLSNARERVVQQQELYDTMRDEYEKLISQVNDIQAQIDAFTSLRTPSKPVELAASAAVSTRKSQTRRRRRARRQLESDSDEGSFHSGVPEVEGLKPFSPATISLKQQKKSESSCSKTTKNDSGEIKTGSKKSLNVLQNEVHMSTAGSTAAVFQQQDAVQLTRNNREGSGGSESSCSESDVSLPCETFVSKRFPDDIFLKKTPSIDGIDSAISPNVSANATLLETDSDQSIWSCASPKKATGPMDTTIETDLDQSIW